QTDMDQLPKYATVHPSYHSTADTGIEIYPQNESIAQSVSWQKAAAGNSLHHNLANTIPVCHHQSSPGQPRKYLFQKTHTDEKRHYNCRQSSPPLPEHPSA